MAATEALLSQLIHLCSSEYVAGERAVAIAELCFPSCDDYDCKDTTSNVFSSWVPRVQTVPEPNTKQGAPPKFILDASQMHQIARFVLPKELAFRKWQRLFSLKRDGAKFDDCMKRIHGSTQTLMIIRTNRGDIFGGYADGAWEHNNYEYYGGTETKLFSFVDPKKRRTRSTSNEDSDSLVLSKDAIQSPDSRDDLEDCEENNTQKDPLQVYRWSGVNRDFQYCDPSRTLLGFGGGGARFGLSIEQNFRYGSTGSCDTFQNHPLCRDNNFRVVDVEFWGFVSLEDPCCSYLCFQPPSTPVEDLNWIPPVRVVREPCHSENFILSTVQMNQIARYVLPQAIAACRWKRVYSLARDGDSFESCLHLARKEQKSLMVIRTVDNKIFGGYADSPWRAGNCNYYGSAQANLWTFAADSNETAPTTNIGDRRQVKVYKWTGVNRYIQYCDITHQVLAFGGGGEAGSFGLCVEKEFQMGSTGPCATFGNDPLCNEEHFKIVDLEIWGFMTGQF